MFIVRLHKADAILIVFQLFKRFETKCKPNKILKIEATLTKSGTSSSSVTLIGICIKLDKY